MRYHILLTGLILAFALAVPVAAKQSATPPKHSAEPKSLGIFGGWQAYASNEHGETVCYMALRTKGAAIKKTKRGPVVLMITQRPGDNSRDVVSYTAGYNFKAASDMEVSVGKVNFSLFTQKDTAWSRDAMTDHALATAIRKSPTLIATGLPAAHSAGGVKDTISLKGAAQAYQAIGKACGIEDEAPSKSAPAKKKKPK